MDCHLLAWGARGRRFESFHTDHELRQRPLSSDTQGPFSWSTALTLITQEDNKALVLVGARFFNYEVPM